MRSAAHAIAVLLVMAFAGPARAAASGDGELAEQQFIGEYALGVRRLPMDGGRIYGWQINDRVNFGRFKGENHGFGFSVELNKRERVEITTEGLRWRRSIGGGR